MTRRERTETDLQRDYRDTENNLLGLQDLEVGQKVFVGISFTDNITTILPALVLAVLPRRVRLRVPAPPGHNPVTLVKTIKPKAITPRTVTHDIVDCESNKSHKERVIENHPRLPASHLATEWD